MKRILLLSFAFLTVIAFSAMAQRTVSGKVTDDTGEALPGVNVVIKGTTTGTTTDLDGNYRLSVDDGATLVYSYVGFETQEVQVGARSTIDISLGGATELQEVVVTGYGVETKRDLTGSIANVGEAEIRNTTLQSFDRAIQGRAAGVQVQAASGQPGGSVRILVRGQGSLANNTPLYIVDGIQINTNDVAGQGSDNVLAGLNPNDIESIEILKDAAAAAIYGAQSANGVVLITTKKGKLNSTDVEFSYQRGITKPIGQYDVMNAQQLATIKAESYTNAGLDPTTAYPIFGNPEDPSTLNNFDWVDAMFNDPADMHIVNGRISGGTDKTRFYLSLSSESQEGQIIKSEWERQTIRANINHNASDKISFGTTLGVSRQRFFGSIENGNFVNGPFQAMYLLQPNSPAFDENGEYNPYPAHFGETGAGHQFNYNIHQGVNEERREAFIGQVLASLNVTYKVTDFLTWNVFGGVDWVDSRSRNERPPTIPVFAGFNGQVFQDDRSQINWNANTTLNFNKTFGEDHNVSVLVGTEWKEDIRENFDATVRQFGNGEFLRQFDQGTDFRDVNGNINKFQRFGMFSRASYNFANKYYINGTVRRDGNSKFGATTRFGTFYSIGSSWRVVEESFMSGSFMDELKLRFSYGILGNANGIGDYESISAYRGERQYLGTAGQVVVVSNDALTWEESEQFNVGVDFGVLGNRLSGSVDYFKNDTDGQLFTVPLTDDAAAGSVISNVGAVRNSGVEVELSSVNYDNGDFKWSSSFNITFIKNELLSLPNNEDTLGTTLIVGQPVDFFWGVDYAGVNPANGRPLYRTRDGSLEYGNLGNDDAYIIGSPIPDYYGGFSNTFSYKGLTLDIFFQYQIGNEAFNADLYNLAYSGSQADNQLVSQLGRWQQPGDITNVPIAVNGGIIDGFDTQFPGVTPSRYMSDGSYIRLKQIMLGYEIPGAILDNTGFIKSANVFLSATNLLTWTKYDGIDPEVTVQNNETGASSYGTFPVGKQITGGITVRF
ncbi:TonB-dependent receptor [Ekhidna sp.]|uniref:SusC/RagA family TonB-linked outer membrane protein n=1 Tax=Ekhidna sp. TaxID=2608089 RepID=UPI0032EBBD1D